MLNFSILIFSVFMLATAPVIVKFSTLAPVSILIWRLLIVSIILFPFCIKNRFKIERTDFKFIMVASVFLLFHFLFWFSGVQKLPVGVTSCIYATNPIYTAIIGHFVISEKFNPKFAIAIIFSIIGVVIVSMSKANGVVDYVGVFQILMASVFYSSYMVYSKKNRTKIANSTYNFYLNFFTSLLGIIVFLVMKLNGSEIDLFEVNHFDIFILFLLALLPSIFGHTLMIYSIKHFNLNFISCFKLFSPLIASCLAYLFFEEKVSENLILGFSFVASGVLFSLNWKKRKI